MPSDEEKITNKKSSKKKKQKRNSVNKHTCTSDDSGNEAVLNKSQTTSQYLVNLLPNIKREILSDIELDVEPDVTPKKKNKENKVQKNATKAECVSDSEDNSNQIISLRRDASSFYVRDQSKGVNTHVMQDTLQSDSDGDSDATTRSRVTILQDICLTPQKTDPQEKLKAMYPGLKNIEIGTDVKLSESDEVHWFRVLKNIDPKQLKNMEIDLENKCKIKLQEKYIITPTNDVPDPKLVISANSKVLVLKNNITMEKYIKSKKQDNVEILDKQSVPLQDNLKPRHPLFGPDFQPKMTLNDDLEKKFDEAIENFTKREKKLKKKKKKSTKHVEETESNQDIFNLLESHISLINTDGIKKELSDDSAFGSSSSVGKSTNKSKKNKADLSDRNIKQEIEIYPEPDFSEEITSPKKKLKKTHQEEWPDAASIKKEGTDETPKIVNKRKSLINSTLTADSIRTPKFSPNVSRIASEEETPSGKKLKKSKKEKTHMEKDKLISDLLNNLTVELNVSSSKKKKKKHDRSEELDSTVKLEF